MSEINEDDDDIELIPPTPLRVAKRALVMCAIVCRSFLEGGEDVQEEEEFRQQTLDWINTLNIADELEPQEKLLLETPVGSLTTEQRLPYTWQSEGLGVLAWALQKYELPAYDEIVTPAEIADNLYFLDDRASELLISPRLREATEIQQFGELMFSLHWRLRDFMHIDPKPIDFQKVARETWFGPLEIRGLRLIDGDLALGSKSISAASEEERMKCIGIAYERHQAVNWLLGHDELYSEVTTDT